MIEHVTHRRTVNGVEAIVQEQFQADAVIVHLRRHSPLDRAVQYAMPATPEFGDQHQVRMDAHWQAPGDDGLDDPAYRPGLLIREDHARAIHAVLSAHFGETDDTAGLRQALDDQAQAAAEYRNERDEARAEALAVGGKAMGLEDTLEATRETLATVREWHADTRTRLERAETPPILATLDTVDLGPRPDFLWAHPSSTPVDEPVEEVPAPRSLADAQRGLEAMVRDHDPAAIRRMALALTGGPESSTSPGAVFVDDNGDAWTHEKPGIWRVTHCPHPTDHSPNGLHLGRPSSRPINLDVPTVEQSVARAVRQYGAAAVSDALASHLPGTTDTTED